MSPPIRDGSGSSIGSIRLGDGTEISEVRTGAGDVVFSGNTIPDSGDLHARYDATEISASNGDSISTWPDETGNGFDLTAGTAPTYVASGINGNAVLQFDGVDDLLDVSFSALSQPNTVYVVYSFNTTGPGPQIIYDGKNSEQGYGQDSTELRHIFAGSVIESGDTDTRNHIFGALYDGANSTGRLDGSQILSGDAGAQSLDGFRVGADRAFENFADVHVGEILIYPQDKRGIQSDVEAFLSGKWGITI